MMNQRLQDKPLAGPRVCEGTVRAEPVRLLWQPAEQGCFRQVEFRGGKSEIIIRGGFETVDFPAEWNAVDVFGQDSFLGVETFQLPCPQYLHEFARKSPFPVRFRHCRELHGDRGRAGNDPAACQVLEQRAEPRHVIDAAMTVKLPVLHRQKCCNDMRRKFVQRDFKTPLTVVSPFRIDYVSPAVIIDTCGSLPHDTRHGIFCEIRRNVPENSRNDTAEDQNSNCGSETLAEYRHN